MAGYFQKKRVFYSASTLDFKYVFQIQDALRKKEELFFQKRVPQPSAIFDMKKSIIEQILEKDRMLSFPFSAASTNVSTIFEFLATLYNVILIDNTSGSFAASLKNSIYGRILSKEKGILQRFDIGF